MTVRNEVLVRARCACRRGFEPPCPCGATPEGMRIRFAIRRIDMKCSINALSVRPTLRA